MLKKNVFSLKSTVFFVFGIFFFRASAKTLSISPSEFNSGDCCSDSASQNNSTSDIIGVINQSLGKQVLLKDNSTKYTTDLQLNSSTNNINANSCLATDSSSKCYNSSGRKDAEQNFTAINKVLYHFTESYSNINNSDGGNITDHSSDDKSPSPNNSPSFNILSTLLNSNLTFKNDDAITGTTATLGVSPVTIESGALPKEDISDEFSSSRFHLIKNNTNSSATISSHHGSLNYFFEIVLLNSSQQGKEIYVSDEQTNGLKNYYRLETSHFDDGPAETTESDIYKEAAELGDSKGDEPLSLNTSSIQFSLLDVNVSTAPVVQNWFYNLSAKENKNKNVVTNTKDTKILYNQPLYHTEHSGMSTEVSENESTSSNHSFSSVPQEILSTTQIQFLNKTDQAQQTTEPGVKINNYSLESDSFDSANLTFQFAKYEENLTSSANCSIHDTGDEVYHDCKRTTPSQPISKNASYFWDRFFINEDKETTNKNITSSILNVTMTTRDSDSSMNESENSFEENLTKQFFKNHTIHLNSKDDDESILATSSGETHTIDFSFPKQFPSTEIHPESSTPAMIDRIPSVLLATQNNYPANHHFILSEKYNASAIISSNVSYFESKDTKYSQILENKNKSSLSTNDLQFTSNESSMIDDFSISTSNHNLIWNNSIWSSHRIDSNSKQSKDFYYNWKNDSKESIPNKTNLQSSSTPPLVENEAAGKIFWKPSTNLLPPSEAPSVEESKTTERTIFWNLCFTKKPDRFKNPKEIMMTNSPSNTKVFWNLCPTKKPSLTTPIYRPTVSSVPTSTVSSPQPLFDAPLTPNVSLSSSNEIPSESTSSGDDETTSHTTETTGFTLTETEAAPEETTQSLEVLKEDLFPVYWNVPTFQCHKYGLNFSRVKEWGLRQNYQDEFRGEEIAILYDPGEFPALLPASAGRRVQRNGGVPQEGSLTRHLTLFQSHLDKLIPDIDFSGLGVIDFEHWRPVWRQNWGSLSPYREFSRLIEKRRHPFWFSTMVEVEATYRYELGARVFLLDTLRLAKKLRPRAKWGYYGFPFCFNYTPYNNRATCSYEVQLDNDNMYWLFSETTAHYPSLYLKYNDMYSTKRQRFIKGRLDEALRVAQEVPVYPYVWYKYHDNHQFITKGDMVSLLKLPKDYGCKGAVIWGASRDVNSRQKCLALHNYLEEVIGPAVKKIQEETFREGSVDHNLEESSEEGFEEEDLENNEKKNSYDVREFEV